MALIDEVVRFHPTLHSKVANLLIKMFEQILPSDMDNELQLDIRKCIMDRMLFLITYGFYTLPLLIFIQISAKTMDASLLRYFIVNLIKSVDSPYSKRFQNIILDLIAKAEIEHNLDDSDEQ